MSRVVVHYWGDPDVDWAGINQAAEFIHDYCVRYARLGGDYKEKYGTVRFYAHFGLSLHGLCYPGYVYYRFPKWLVRADIYLITPALQKLGLGRLWVWWQSTVYRRAYRLAVRRWAHLREEILCAADYPELLERL